jgi:hypothetical protein
MSRRKKEDISEEARSLLKNNEEKTKLSSWEDQLRDLDRSTEIVKPEKSEELEISRGRSSSPKLGGKTELEQLVLLEDEAKDLRVRRHVLKKVAFLGVKSAELRKDMPRLGRAADLGMDSLIFANVLQNVAPTLTSVDLGAIRAF